MKKMLTALLAAAVAGALFIAAPLTAAPPDTNHNNSESYTVGPQECGENNSLTLRAPEKLWPPNHKYFDDVYALAVDGDEQLITLETTGTHNQYAEDGSEFNGSGNTTRDIYVSDEDADWVTTSDEDADPQVTAVETNVSEETGQPEGDRVQTDWQVRAERSGRDETKSGRTYTLTATAVFSDGDCSLTRTMNVPHDMRPGNR